MAYKQISDDFQFSTAGSMVRFANVYSPSTRFADCRPRYELVLTEAGVEFPSSAPVLKRTFVKKDLLRVGSVFRAPVYPMARPVRDLVAKLAEYDAQNIARDELFKICFRIEVHAFAYEWAFWGRQGVGLSLRRVFIDWTEPEHG